jgi:hypothetical protein
MDYSFSDYYGKIKDSMTEQEFGWQIIAPVISKIRCGHTSMGMSKLYSKWQLKNKSAMFPLLLRIWKDTMVVMRNLHLGDSSIKKGNIVKSINGIDASVLVKTMFNHLSQDGYADNYNYIKLSSAFAYFHRSIFGISKVYNISYNDSAGQYHEIDLPAFIPPKDSTTKDKQKVAIIPPPRNFVIDSTKNFAIMTVNNFTKLNIRFFFRSCFSVLRKNNIPNLILDLRLNGGGRVAASNLLTKYISRKPFKVADTLYSVSNSISPYSRYINGGIFNTLQMILTTKKMSDGKYHFRSLEKKIYKIKNRNHYNGNVYVLTAGPTFSASCLFANAIKGQQGITLVGEETGGGWYGNNGILIPDIVLPKTNLRVRLPLFRLIQFNHPSEMGTGILPDIEIKTNYEALIKGFDKKMSVVKEIISGKSKTDKLTE